MTKEDQEHLVTVKLKDGNAIDFLRTEHKSVIIRHDGHDVVMPKATGRQTLDMLVLLGKFGEIE